MKRVSTLSLISIPLLALAMAGPAAAQATRTWVSGVGDDANPCSRTAPCKTFQGAISKTAAGGEINVLDPGGYGAVTITKSIAINAEWAGEAGVLVTGTNGIIINGAATDIVSLRGLFIEGLGTGINGINILSAGEVNVQDTVIKDFRNGGVGAGINVQPSAATVNVHVVNSVINDNGTTAGGGAGILVKPSGTGKVTLTVDGTTLVGNVVGIKFDGSTAGTQTRGVIRNTTVSNSLTQGITSIATSQVVNVFVDNSLSTNNAGPGTRSDGASSTVTLGRSTLTNNGGPGLSSLNTGKFKTFSNNQVSGNSGTDATPTAIPAT